MSAIEEEDVASDIVAADFSELLDLPDIAFGAVEDITNDMRLEFDTWQPLSPSGLDSAE